MAEVRKNKKNEKYDIDEMTDLKVESKKKEKEVKKTDTKKNNKKKDDKEKKSFKVKWRTFWHGVANELKVIHWPTKEKMVKYSIVTILFVVFLACFFYFIDVIFAFVQSLFN